ncbi:hypothetical protein [Halobacteriovorax marinus]|nr:hypothetical protein [Halobacteriovorax marinus]
MTNTKLEIELSEDMEKEFEEMAQRKLEKYSEQLDSAADSSKE